METNNIGGPQFRPLGQNPGVGTGRNVGGKAETPNEEVIAQRGDGLDLTGGVAPAGQPAPQSLIAHDEGQIAGAATAAPRAQGPVGFTQLPQQVPVTLLGDEGIAAIGGGHTVSGSARTERLGVMAQLQETAAVGEQPQGTPFAPGTLVGPSSMAQFQRPDGTLDVDRIYMNI